MLISSKTLFSYTTTSSTNSRQIHLLVTIKFLQKR